MNKKYLVSWLAILTIAACQNLYAHNADPGIEKREDERKETREQEARETWDDFMSAIKEQEAKADAGKESGQENSTGH
ncbi:MAG: hypothetical protein BMS9Abin19_0418 [Gammaproteobacteria bacterium]|nr:MAG: hypothetical protein BMS9Abin19_0418 [Gammaproteobacteria bacterium]